MLPVSFGSTRLILPNWQRKLAWKLLPSKPGMSVRWGSARASSNTRMETACSSMGSLANARSTPHGRANAGLGPFGSPISALLKLGPRLARFALEVARASSTSLKPLSSRQRSSGCSALQPGVLNLSKQLSAVIAICLHTSSHLGRVCR